LPTSSPDIIIEQYDRWIDQYRAVFQSKLLAIKDVWPGGEQLISVEIGTVSGRLAAALCVHEGLQTTTGLEKPAEQIPVATIPGLAEDLPYENEQADVILMNGCISHVKDVPRALNEAHRVLKPGGMLILSFIDRNSELASHYEAHLSEGAFRPYTRLYTAEEIQTLLNHAGFQQLNFSQTLFGSLHTITGVQQPRSGYGEGSFVVVKCRR